MNPSRHSDGCVTLFLFLGATCGIRVERQQGPLQSQPQSPGKLGASKKLKPHTKVVVPGAIKQPGGKEIGGKNCHNK